MLDKDLDSSWGCPADQRGLDAFLSRQLDVWPQAKARFVALHEQAKRRELGEDAHLSAQFNPARIASATARVSNGQVAERPCFLCAENRPAEQVAVPLRDGLELLVNPFPILPAHFTIPTTAHTPQRWETLCEAMLRLSEKWDDTLFFYNGPRCGASAPDHAHLQAGKRGCVPIERDFLSVFEGAERLYPASKADGAMPNPLSSGIYLLKHFCCAAFVVIGASAEETAPQLRILTDALPREEGREEPDINVLCWMQECPSESSSQERLDRKQVVVVFPRRKHRPECYFAEGDAQMLVSPGALDMGGLIVCAREEDYNRMTAARAAEILREVSITPLEAKLAGLRVKHPERYSDAARTLEPLVSVGIMHADSLRFHLDDGSRYTPNAGDGEQVVTMADDTMLWNGRSLPEGQDIALKSTDEAATFTVEGVRIGKEFHWQQDEAQTFRGSLQIVRDDDRRLALINNIGVEAYLESVVSSEMSGRAPLEFLKAHAVISRSWLLRRLMEDADAATCACSNAPTIETSTDGHESILRWYGAESHRLYDVCADDHCQRYQGVGRITPAAREAVRQTHGLALVYGDEICDARFSKCCGGRTEVFASCWEDRDVPYLQAVDDADERGTFCQRATPELLQRSMNNYDLMTRDFFSWSVSYDADELSEIVEQKGHLGLGRILSLEPLERGESGRIVRLRIVGEKRTVDVGKELEIRRMLSHSHLYSSAFDVEKTPQGFTLSGRGWGHGVGLCQIGAAVMADEGYTFEQILTHYYINASVKRIY